MFNLEYCKKWFIAKKRPIDILTSAEAAILHDSREPYTVLVNQNNLLKCFIEVSDNFYVVSFIDDTKRITLSYQFKIIDNKLFLLLATHIEHQGETEKVKERTLYVFKVDGSLYIEKTDYLTSESTSAKSKVDVKNNWEDIPAFGEYSKLQILDRQCAELNR